ncbi:MAG: MBL fold metallo-hydrolase [Pseudomonadota bacterium]
MKVSVHPVTPFQQNCSLIWCEKTKRGAFVDPGGDVPVLLASAADHGVEIDKILVTHAHIDHAGAVASIAEELEVPIEGPHEADQFWIDALPSQGEMFNFPPTRPFAPNRWLQQNDEVTIGEEKLLVRHCPGHTPGHVIFFSEDARIAFVGDVLFRGSIGRTDFPRGDHATLINSIKEQLWPLGNDVVFVPGHGPTSTFGEERQHNPFVAD